MTHIGENDYLDENKQNEQARQSRALRQRAALITLTFDEAIAAGETVLAAQRLTEATAAAIVVERVSLWLFNEDGEEMHCIDLYEASKQLHSHGAILTNRAYPAYWQAIRTDSQINADDARTDPRTIEFRDGYLVPLGITSMLDAGVLAGGKLMGVVCFEHTGPKRVWHSDEQVFANMIAGLMAQALVNAEQKRAEEEIRQSHETYKGLIDSITESLYVQDEAGVFLDINETAVKFYSYHRDEIIGRTPEFLAAPGKNDLPLLAQLHHQAFHGQPQTLEFWGKRKDGTIFPKEVTLSAGTYFGQKVVIAVGRDISKRKYAEMRQKASEANLKAILENSLESIWSVDTSYRIEYINEVFQTAFFHSFGVTLQKGMNIVDCLPDSLKPTWQGRYDRAFNNENGVFLDKIELGETAVYVEVAMHPIVLDGQVVGASFYGKNITEQKLAELQIHYESELRNLLLALSTNFINLPVDALEAAIYRSLTELGQFVGADRAYLFEYDFVAETASNSYEWCAEGVEPQIDKLQGIAIADVPYWVEAHQRGEPLYVPNVQALTGEEPESLRAILEPQGIKSLITLPMINDGRLLGFVGFDSVHQYHHYGLYEQQLLQIYTQMLVNVWERQHMEKTMRHAQEDLARLQRLESIGTLAGGIAHDFNNLLMGLFGNISIAKLKLAPDHPATLALNKAEQAMDRATRLTQQLLTFARGGDPVRQVCAIGPFIAETAQFDLSGRNVQPVITYPPDLWLADVDKGQIQQAISNLTINAMQAMPVGGHLYLTLANKALADGEIPPLPAGRYIQIIVQDEGTGIDPKHLKRIFDPYFTTKQSGSGLGLATTYSIVHKHGGLITAVSELGQGATFTIYLPAASPSALAEATPSAANAASAAPAIRILVMDDEPLLRSTFSEMLSSAGYETVAVANGQKAIAAYQEALVAGHPFTAVIMDLTIPGGMGGREAVQGILAIDPQARCLVSSGYATDPIMANPAEYGFKGVIRKPFALRHLLQAVEQLLQS